MDRDAIAAVTRIPDDKTHVNRLRAPHIGIVKLCLATATRASLSHLPADAPPPTAVDAGTDGFHFIPEKEAIEIQYEIDDPFGHIDTASLEIYTRFDDQPIYKLDLETLGPAWWTHGKHAVKWDGRIVKPTKKVAGKVERDTTKHDLTKLSADKTVDALKFPDGYMTIEHTPCKVKLTVGSATLTDKPAVAWTYFQILIKKIELELGVEKLIPATTVGDDRHLRDKAVRTRMVADGGMPAVGATRKVILLSNVYRSSLAHMDDDTAHEKYKTLWGTGPNIPIVAKIRLADSNDVEVKLDESDKGAVALGNVRFLWDWEDHPEDVDGAQAQAAPKAFIKDSIHYYKDGTDGTRAAKDHEYPKGDNCHVDRGGKRGPDGQPVFPAQPGYDPKDSLDTGKFPFKVETTLKKRKWAAYSRAWTKKALKGRTGVVFQPSRMAGDIYKVTVYLAFDKTAKDTFLLDDQAEPLVTPTVIKASTGMFQVWREIHLARYVHKDGLPAPLLPGSLPGVQAHLRRAYVEMVDKMGTDNAYALSKHKLANGSDPKYDAICKAELATNGSYLFSDEVAAAKTFDHASVGSMFKVRTYPQFVLACYKKYFDPTAASMANWTDGNLTDFGEADLAVWGRDGDAQLVACQAWLKSEGLERYGKYSKKLGDIFFAVSDAIAGKLALIAGGKKGHAGAPDGVTTLEFDFTDDYLKLIVQSGWAYDWCWYGKVVDPGDHTEKKSMIMFWERQAATGTDKFAHELGHNLFLPHSKDETGGAPSGTLVARHDDADGKCLMSYNGVRDGFCGLCQLRMRGWTTLQLQNTSASNKKP